MKYPIGNLAFALAAVAAIGCGDPPTGTSGGEGQVGILADLTGLGVAGLVVEVTAADIPRPLVFNIPIVAGVASGTIMVPAGSDRTIAVTGLDGGGVATHRGSTTVDIVEGTNPPISIALIPLDGSVPVEVTGNGLVVTVDPPSGTIDAGQNAQFTAAVTDPGGTPQNVSVSWGSTNPLVATVDATGLVTGVGAGTAEIVASAGGASGTALVIVGSAPVARFTLPFYDQALDLDAGAVVDCDPTAGCSGSAPAGWDFSLAFNSTTATAARVFQNEGAAVEIAHLAGAVFEDVTPADAAAATFTTGLVNEPFDASRVILIKTDLGLIYKLGNPVETLGDVTFDTQLLAGT